MRYLIAFDPSLSEAYVACHNPTSHWCLNGNDDIEAISVLPEFALSGRFVTLDHVPSYEEVRTLLEGPDPLSECLEELKNTSSVLWSAYRHLDRLEGVIAENEAKCVLKAYKRIESLLEKYREGGK